VAQPRHLNRPPIVEALVDLRASVPGDPGTFIALAGKLRDEFPVNEQQNEVQGTIEIKEGKVVLPHVSPPSFAGVRIANVDKTVYVQFRPDGFTLNNCKVYMGGDQLIDKALSLWEALVERNRPEIVSRVAMRYINRLELPLKDGDPFERYLTSAPKLPRGTPNLVSEFLTRIVGHDTQRQATAVVIQQLKQQGEQPVSVTVDVDVFRAESFPVDSAALREVLSSLRLVKNNTFFSLLTDETVSFYE